jgi:hypothetical protein
MEKNCFQATLEPCTHTSCDLETRAKGFVPAPACTACTSTGTQMALARERENLSKLETTADEVGGRWGTGRVVEAGRTGRNGTSASRVQRAQSRNCGSGPQKNRYLDLCMQGGHEGQTCTSSGVTVVLAFMIQSEYSRERPFADKL